MDIQLSSSSVAEFKDLNLDVNAINEALEDAQIPLEVVDGFIGKVSLNVPLSTILKESTALTIKELEITVRPKKRDVNSEFCLKTWRCLIN